MPTAKQPSPPPGVFNPGNLTSNTFTGGFKPPEYVENPIELEEDSKISDETRNFWEPAHTEPGVPPLLTMPGIQTANDLVIVHVLSISIFRKLLFCVFF